MVLILSSIGVDSHAAGKPPRSRGCRSICKKLDTERRGAGTAKLNGLITLAGIDLFSTAKRVRVRWARCNQQRYLGPWNQQA